jgi:hypothetical protein
MVLLFPFLWLFAVQRPVTVKIFDFEGKDVSVDAGDSFLKVPDTRPKRNDLTMIMMLL